MPSAKRIALATLLLAIYIITATVFYIVYIAPVESSVSARYEELAKPSHPYTFQIPLYFSFNGTVPFGLINETDFSFLLKFTYTNETLVANESVTINATAVFTAVVTTLDHVSIIFPNALISPVTYGENGFPKQGILEFRNPVSIVDGENITIAKVLYETDANIMWPIEGDYAPIVGFFFKDGTNKIYTAANMVIHVYPQEQLTQIETEKVSLETNLASLRLSEVVLMLSTISILALIVQILDRGEGNKCAKNTGNNSQPRPNVKNKETNEKRSNLQKKH